MKTCTALVHRTALENLKHAQHEKIMSMITREHEISGAFWDAFNNFKVVTDEPLTLKQAKEHAEQFNISWDELKPFWKKSQRFWLKIHHKNELGANKDE